MSLPSNDPGDIEQYIAEQLSGLKFIASTIAHLKTGPKVRFGTRYITDTSKPAWADVNGVWRYADGTLV